MALLSPALKAQLSGKIRNNKGFGLPYATIFIKGSTKGTFSNELGEYELELTPGENTIVYKYVGFATKEIYVKNDGSRIIRDIILDDDNIILQTVEIKPDDEDPAYAIIRKAIKAKEKYRNKPDNYSARIYQKFQMEMLDVPQKIMGIEIAKTDEDKEEIAGMLDTSNNVVFVMENVSDYFKGEGEQFKERIISSRISGDKDSYFSLISGFSELDFYDNYLELGRKMITPLSSNALLFYDYKLKGTFFDENGHLINKIRVIPKNSHDPVFEGDLFIVEDQWNIHSLDLITDSNKSNIRFLDTISIKQNYHLVDRKSEERVLLSQYLTLGISIFGIKTKGYFAKNFVDYELNQLYPEGFFSRILVNVEEESNKRDSIYWEKIRPIPLSIKEKRAYFRMDSVERVTESKEYLDSMDRKSNKLKLTDLLTSYTYRNSYSDYRWTIKAPFLETKYNPIQGFHSNIDIDFEKTRNNKKKYAIRSNFEYGLADNQLLPTVSFEDILDNRYQFKYSLTAGRKYMQPGEQRIMSALINSLTSLIQGKNYIQLYRKDFVRFDISRNFIPGIQAKVSMEYSQRDPLQRNTNYMFITDKWFDPIIFEEGAGITYPNKLNIKIHISYTPGTKYIDMPNELVMIRAKKLPLFYVEYDKAMGFNDQFVDYDLIKAGVKGKLSSGFLGTTSYHLEGGIFPTNKSVDIIDDFYIRGNERYYVKNYKFREAFHLLPYYNGTGFRPYSYLKIHQDLNGLLVNKIPLIRKLKIKEAASFKLLQVQNEKLYYEVGVGVDNLFGFASLRYTWGFTGTELYDRRFTFSFNMTGFNVQL